MITQCCIHELYLQGKSQQAAVDLAKSFQRRKCNHREAVPGEECIASVVGKPSCFVDAYGSDLSAGDPNKHRYVVATQSQTLRAKLRLIPAVPIVHINRAVMILEPPSDVTLEAKHQASPTEPASRHLLILEAQNEERASQPSATELATIGTDTPAEPPHRRRVPKGPNPLSVKKKVAPRASRPIPTSDVPPNADIVLGQKRKSIGDEENTIAPAARKRKRRRKHTTATDVLP